MFRLELDFWAIMVHCPFYSDEYVLGFVISQVSCLENLYCFEVSMVLNDDVRGQARPRTGLVVQCLTHFCGGEGSLLL